MWKLIGVGVAGLIIGGTSVYFAVKDNDKKIEKENSDYAKAIVDLNFDLINTKNERDYWIRKAKSYEGKEIKEETNSNEKK